ncbi:nicotinate-nucleotide--dimethylbenzimidazole phosphoribosyltransferase [Desulfovibrionales bacterium]
MTALAQTLARIAPLDPAYFVQAQAHQDILTKPKGSLGMLETLANRLVAIAQGQAPRVDPARIYTCAGDHGVTAQGVSLFPQEVTRQMVENFMRQGAAINVLTRTAGIDLKVVDTGCVGGAFREHPSLIQCKIAPGTADVSTGPAMTRAQCLQALENGISLAEQATQEGIVTLGTGEMGIGNTTAATALYCAYLGLTPQNITGPGTGLDQAGIAHKIQVISSALVLHDACIRAADPIDILAALGGFEIATLTGLLLGGASLRRVLVIDGFISTSALVAARAICPAVIDYAFFSHVSAEPGFLSVLHALDIRPILDLGLRLGEGTGAAMAIFLLRCAANIYTDMATFADAQVHSGPR